MKKYLIDVTWDVLFADVGLNMGDVLRHAQLPLDLLSRKQPTLTAAEYLTLWESLLYVARAAPAFPLLLGRSVSVDAFSPPLFACFCSPNLNVALERLAEYKPLVGPLSLTVETGAATTDITVSGLPENGPAPPSLLAMEAVFFVQMARTALREEIVPEAVLLRGNLPAAEAYEAYFGCPVRWGSAATCVRFKAADAAKPFLTANEGMWAIFEPELQTRMADLTQEATFRERVRACLMEILAGGQASMAAVAGRLAVSTRTLQRRLKAEGTSFQQELDTLREELARNYLTRSDYTSAQIAFLLGYQDPNSFFRAFQNWTGQTPETVRAAVQ